LLLSSLNNILYKVFVRIQIYSKGPTLKKIEIFLLAISITLSSYLFSPFSTFSQGSLHIKINLRGFDGNPLTLESKMPYSLKKPVGVAMTMIKLPTVTISSRVGPMELEKLSSVTHSILNTLGICP